MIVRGWLIAALMLGLTGAVQAAAFTVTSPAFADDGTLPQNGAQPKCGGQSVSPPLAWANVPAGVQSFAVTLYDPDAPGGPGFLHWVAYGIPASVSSLPAGFGAGATGHVGGANGAGSQVFLGYAPPAGETPHHYTFTVYATDLAPDALSPGLNRDALLAALHGHVKGAQSIVGRFGC
jgi:Raf kinase inhibitor-like YbhB/YbcL family protein